MLFSYMNTNKNSNKKKKKQKKKNERKKTHIAITSIGARFSSCSHCEYEDGVQSSYDRDHTFSSVNNQNTSEVSGIHTFYWFSHILLVMKKKKTIFHLIYWKRWQGIGCEIKKAAKRRFATSEPQYSHNEWIIIIRKIQARNWICGTECLCTPCIFIPFPLKCANRLITMTNGSPDKRTTRRRKRKNEFLSNLIRFKMWN